MQLVHLHAQDTTVLVDVGTGVPTLVYWGPQTGPVSEATHGLLDRPVPPSSPDTEPPVTLVPLTSSGFAGAPGLVGAHVDGTGAFPVFGAGHWIATETSLHFSTVDEAGELRLEGTIEVGDVLQISCSVTNLAATPYRLDGLSVTVPLPHDADELLRFDGRWSKEFTPTRTPWRGGVQVIENRRGRTSHDHVPVGFTGPRGFGEANGRVHGLHLGWSGNSALRFEQLSDGRRIVQLGELLAPAEVVLGSGETYTTPTLFGTWGDGLTMASQRFHRLVRSWLPAGPRPIGLNTWEAVYFDHDHATLFALAERAAAVGVERFVLDDGWFGSRRDDTAGLGDWWVSPDVYPDGLGPLIDHVTDLGMQFGIWVEPEMVNPDSELYRAHPEWVLGNPAVTGRHQLVLNLADDRCWQYLFDALDRLLSDHDITYVKWDMNRDLAGAGAHHQTVALYRLLDALGEAHPGVEFESCASGGGRADFGVLARTCRIWTSDCNDALERQTIQRGFSHLFPPEVMGAHIGPPRAHTTGRQHRLAFRAATALFGHLGIEWNLLDASDRHLDALRTWIALHKELRPLLHGGDVVRLDSPDPAGQAHGVVSPDRTEALFCHAQLSTAVTSVPPRLTPRGLDPGRDYRVEHLAVPGEVFGLARLPRWMAEPIVAPGRLLETVGIQLPVLQPESALLIRLTAVR